jgi:elongation factor G
MRSKSRATYTMEFKHYAAAPRHILGQVASGEAAR